MRATTVIVRRNKINPLFLVELEKEIVNALTRFGYDLEKIELTLRPCVFARCVVMVNGRYFGMWDHIRATFVD